MPKRASGLRRSGLPALVLSLQLLASGATPIARAAVAESSQPVRLAHAPVAGGRIGMNDWPQWRGPDRSNASRETGLLREWPPEGPALVWTAKGLGVGIAAVAVAGGRIYTLGYVDEAEYLHCLDEETGEPRWSAPIGSSGDQKAVGLNTQMRWLSPRVPTVDTDRVYTISAAGVLTCLRTADGASQWRVAYPAEFRSPRRIWGFCDYPLVDGDKLIVAPVGPDAAVVALDKRTGNVIWRCGLPSEDGAGHGAMVVSEAGGVRQYVTLLAKSLIGVAANDGRLLWRHPGVALRVASSYTPIVHGDLVASPNGYAGGLTLLRLTRAGDQFTPVQEYFEKLDFNPFQDATVLDGERLHAIEGPGRVTCIELRTGQRLWAQDLPQATRRAALTLADERLYVRRSDGSVTLLESTPGAYVERGRFEIPAPEEAMGVTFPVVANGRLYLRDNDRLLCYHVRVGAPPEHAGAVHAVVVPKRESRIARPRIGSPTTPGAADRAPDAIFVPTPGDVIVNMLALARVQSTNVVYDLGSGDGRIVIAAARTYGCRAVGIEIDPHLVAESREAIRLGGLEHLVRIEHADFFTADFSEADVVTAYLPSTLLERLVPQFRKLKPGARIVTHQFPIPGLSPDTGNAFVSREDGDFHRIWRWLSPVGPSPP